MPADEKAFIEYAKSQYQTALEIINSVSGGDREVFLKMLEKLPTILELDEMWLATKV